MRSLVPCALELVNAELHELVGNSGTLRTVVAHDGLAVPESDARVVRGRADAGTAALGGQVRDSSALDAGRSHVDVLVFAEPDAALVRRLLALGHYARYLVLGAYKTEQRSIR